MMTRNEPDAHDRRAFFRESLARAIQPLGDFIERRFDIAGPRTFLRPPGALPEPAFSETCWQSGMCIEICPVVAIVAHPGDRDTLAGTPMIDPGQAACVICEGLECMNVCPSGALRLVDSVHSIRMGTAEVRESVCVRSRGEDCTICVERCPIGDAALRFLNSGPPEVLTDGCVGCGVCQLSCPTTPKAIVVIPR